MGQQQGLELMQPAMLSPTLRERPVGRCTKVNLSTKTADHWRSRQHFVVTWQRGCLLKFVDRELIGVLATLAVACRLSRYESTGLSRGSRRCAFELVTARKFCMSQQTRGAPGASLFKSFAFSFPVSCVSNASQRSSVESAKGICLWAEML